MGGRESESWAMRSQDLIFRKLFAVKGSERRSSFPNVCVVTWFCKRLSNRFLTGKVFRATEIRVRSQGIVNIAGDGADHAAGQMWSKRTSAKLSLVI